MIKELKRLTMQAIAGANVASIIVLLLVGYSDHLNPEHFPLLSNIGLAFPFFLFINLCFLAFWLIFKVRYAIIPFVGFLVCYVPVRKYTPFNLGENAPAGSIKILSYNTWAYAEHKEGDSLNPVNPVIDYVRRSGADIVCLQEAAPNAAEQQQIDSLLRPIYAYIDTTHHSDVGECLMVCSKFPILSKERIPYPSKGNLSAAYRLKIGRKEVLLINNHLETTGLTLEERRKFKNMMKGKLETDTAEQTSKLLVVKLGEATRKRAPQAEAVARYIKQHKKESIILCGDFNDGPISYAHRTIAQGLTDCYVATGNGPGISYHHAGFFVRIDNIMCSDDWVPYGCKVDDKIGVSDHYPILCSLKRSPKHQK